MDKRTEDVLKKISGGIPKEMIDKAHTTKVEDRSEMRDTAQRLIRYLGTDKAASKFTTRQSAELQMKIQAQLNNGAFDDIKSTYTNEAEVQKLHDYTAAKVQSAIRTGRIPRPTARDMKLKIKQ